ncbi:uncharacterized protein A4U43_C09F3460 [Asparagus officinalis]|uniref:Alkyl transferase n=1 Tax=Asparagus officinalis TaxID=4686 RepID=A0A5P1E8C5_ASPOF|nr:uncharacterized protein A4U43_C09F3460 [Asparagus officinalis]
MSSKRGHAVMERELAHKDEELKVVAVGARHHKAQLAQALEKGQLPPKFLLKEDCFKYPSRAANYLDVLRTLEVQGKLDTLDEPTREAIQGVMDATAKNTKMVLLICLAYTSTDEIVHGVKGAVTEKIDGDASISVEDLEKNMYYAGCPDPDILVRTSGETRLSNFLLWQTTHCLLYCPRCLWPEISLRHLVWGVVQYQRNYQYLEKIKKKM